MPELPEVETLCRQLNTLLPGLPIRDCKVFDPRLGDPGDLRGLMVKTVSRRGKYIRMVLHDHGSLRNRRGRCPGGGPLALLLHLRMTGRLLWSDEEKPFPPSTRLLMGFDTGRLLLIDPRRFATLSVRPFADYAGLGRDPLSGIKAEDLRGQAGSRRLPIKNFLMDQRFIAGIGNIYACEILHQAGIDPYRSTGSLRKAEWAKVVESMGTVLLRAVACRGTSISDWRDLFGIPGTHQDHLRVYSREGMPCPGCGQAIVRGKLNGRGTWHCPACQR